MLYARDYKLLTEDEKLAWEKVENKFNQAKKDNRVNLKHLNEYWKNIPLAVRYHKKLFPNNFLDIKDFEQPDLLNEKLRLFKELLDKNANERQILNFFTDKTAHFIVGSLFNKFNFGHHEAFAFKEFQLPPNFKADYLLVGKNSQGYEFIFVELESPNGNITTQNGEFGVTIRKGISQIEAWRSWLEANFSHLKLLFDKSKLEAHLLPDEFIELDTSRIHFVVVVGRRENFNKLTYRFTRNYKKKNDILILHYDNLLDSAASIISSRNYV